MNANSEIQILRSSGIASKKRNAQIRNFYRSNAPESFPVELIPKSPASSTTQKISVRVEHGTNPKFGSEDIVLNDGDILYVKRLNE